MNHQPIHTQIEESQNWGEFYLSPQWKEILTSLSRWYSIEEKRQIWMAYGIAIRAHQNQRRKSWEAYITHIETVVWNIHEHHNTHNQKITAEDIIVAILHDVIEDHPEYFEEIYRTFGYTIVYRVICLSKPSEVLFEKWNRCIPQNQKKWIKNNPVYQLWDTATKIQYPNNLAQIIQADSIIVWYYNTPSVLYPKWATVVANIIKWIRTEYVSELKALSTSSDIPIEIRHKLKKKRWQEYTTALQLLLISVENFRVKFADKIHNLSDVEYRKPDLIVNEEEGLARKRKTKSILRTVPIYQFLCDLHEFAWLVPQFQNAVSRSEVFDTISSS